MPDAKVALHYDDKLKLGFELKIQAIEGRFFPEWATSHTKKSPNQILGTP